MVARESASTISWNKHVDALRRGDVGRIKQLLDGGIDVNSPMAEPKKGAARPTAPLLYAAKQGHVEIVRLLLDRGARIGDALVSTARDGDIPMLQLLLDRGALVNEASPTQRMFTTETALSVAADRGDVAVLRLLLDRGAAVNLPVEHRDSDWTPVFLAARRGHVSAIEVLVARGASVHHTTKSMGAIQGTTPLAVAIASGHRNVARCLLRRGADALTENEEAYNHHVVREMIHNGRVNDDMWARHARALSLSRCARLAGSWRMFAREERFQFALLRALWRRDGPGESPGPQTTPSAPQATPIEKLHTLLTKLFAVPDGILAATLSFHDA